MTEPAKPIETQTDSLRSLITGWALAIILMLIATLFTLAGISTKLDLLITRMSR